MAASVHTDTRTLAWNHGTVTLSAFGAMIGPSTFTLPSGRSVRPFHTAPWLNEPGASDLVGLLAGLQGEWPCVPFGYPISAPNWPAGWDGRIEDTALVTDVHGYGSAAKWRFDGMTETKISMSVDYPDNHTIRRLGRIVRPDPNASALDIELTIHARTACYEPLGLHGCFALPELAHNAILEPGDFAVGRTHPLTIEPTAPIFQSNMTFKSLSEVVSHTGETIDASRLPFVKKGEDLLQLDGIDGHFAMTVPESGYRVTFDWDQHILPSVLLWYSNQGRAASPWNNRHRCIGIEPICSPFGLSPDMARSETPISRDGTATCVNLDPNSPMTISYRIEVTDLP